MSAQKSVSSCKKGSYFGQFFSSESYAKNVISFLKKRMKEMLAYVLEFMLTLAKMQKSSVKKVRNLRMEQFESYSICSYCTHSSVYRVFRPS